MMHVLIILFEMYTSDYLIEAMIVTRYVKNVTPVTSDFIQCGVNAGTEDFCAARVTENNTCEPLTKSWCELKDMSTAGSYFIKDTAMDTPETTRLSVYQEKALIYFAVGSEVEVKFMLHTEWTGFRVSLRDNALKNVIRIWFEPSNDTGSLNYYLLQNQQTFHNALFAGMQYTLRIVCGTNDFQIFLDGAHYWNYTTGLPINSITGVKVRFFGVSGDLYEIKYTA